MSIARVQAKLEAIKRYLFEPRFHFSRFQFNLVAIFFMTVGLVAGTYLTLSGAIPRIFALNDTAKTWTFNTANAGSYTTSLTIVDDNGAHPTGGTVGANELTNPAFGSDNSSWSVAAVPPSGWVEVPGNATFGTTNFLAMKYEAKCAATSDPTTGLTSPDTGYNTYSDSGTACTSANSKQVVSVASGYPIARISHTDALTRCSTVTLNGNTAHLMRNDEWMTVARDAEPRRVTGVWAVSAAAICLRAIMTTCPPKPESLLLPTPATMPVLIPTAIQEQKARQEAARPILPAANRGQAETKKGSSPYQTVLTFGI